jgi:hypothetical protein
MVRGSTEPVSGRQRSGELSPKTRFEPVHPDQRWWSLRLDSANPAALILMTLLFSVTIVPWIPDLPIVSLDSSWASVHNHGFQHGWQWGSDIVFTYGPWSWLVAPQYHPSTYLLLVTVWICICFVLSQTFLHLRPGTALAYWASTTLLFMALISATYPLAKFFSVSTTTLFMTLPLFCALVHVQHRERPFWVVQVGLVAVMALSGSIQFLYLLLSVTALLLLDCHHVLARRSYPFYLPIWIAFFLFFRWVAGQELRSLPAFFHFSLEFATGYSDAMSLRGPFREVICFAIIALFTLGLVTLREYRLWRQSETRVPWNGFLVVLVWGLSFFAVFKNGFVRHDGHAVRAWSWLLAATLLYGFRFQPIKGRFRFGIAFPVLVIVSVFGWLHQVSSWFAIPTLEPASDFVEKFHPQRLGDLINIVALDGRAELWQGQNDALANIRRMAALPPLPDTVDIVPWNEVIPLASGMDYRPLPVFQSIAVYTAGLDSLNRARLLSEDAPTIIALQWVGVDGRWPTLGMGSTIAVAFSLYQTREIYGNYVILQRRDSPAQLVTEGLNRLRGQLHDWLLIRSGDSRLMASFSFQKTLMGRAGGTLYKLPHLLMDVRFEGGAIETFRMIPGMAEAGFLLSPLPDTPRASASLFSSGAKIQGRRVAAIRIRDTGPRGRFWRPEFSVTLETVGFLVP